MNDKGIQDLFSKMKAEKLSVVERARIREHLVNEIYHEPVPTYHEFSYMRFVQVFSSHRVAVATFTVFIVVFGGISYAAEGALPGNTLYALKKGINEPIRSVFAISEIAKTQLEADLANRRLGEASALALQDKLDEFTQEKLLAEVVEHATALRILLDKAGDTLDEDDVTKLAARLEGSREARSALSARVNPASASSRAFVVESAPEPVSMMMAVMEAPEVPSEDSVADTASLKAAGVVPVFVKSASEESLLRVEEEYEKALFILNTRLGKFSREKERISSSENQDASFNDNQENASDDSDTENDRRSGSDKAED